MARCCACPLVNGSSMCPFLYNIYQYMWVSQKSEYCYLCTIGTELDITSLKNANQPSAHFSARVACKNGTNMLQHILLWDHSSIKAGLWKRSTQSSWKEAYQQRFWCWPQEKCFSPIWLSMIQNEVDKGRGLGTTAKHMPVKQIIMIGHTQGRYGQLLLVTTSCPFTKLKKKKPIMQELHIKGNMQPVCHSTGRWGCDVRSILLWQKCSKRHKEGRKPGSKGCWYRKIWSKHYTSTLADVG